MDLAQPVSRAENYYDRRDDRRRLVRDILVGSPIIILSLWFVLTPEHWTYHAPVSIAASLCLLAAAFRLPYAVRNCLLALRGAPALSIDDRGLWSRTLAGLGWIKWSEIAEVVIQVSKPTRESEDLQRSLGLRLSDEAYARVPWSYRVSQIAAALMCMAVGYRDDPHVLCAISSSQLTGTWEELMAVLEPIFTAKGISMREDKV
jgi:hypothetical protein